MKSAAGLSYMTRSDERAQDTLPLGSTPKVFISYKKDEKKQVTDEGLLYTRDLAAKRIVNLSDCAVWHDGLLTPGGDYNTEIRSAILECDAVVLLLTGNVLNSRYIWDVEISLARENNKIIIPIAFDFPKLKYRYVEESIGNVHIISWPGGGDDDATQREDREFNDALGRALDRLTVSSSLAGEINKIQEIINGRSSLVDISLNSWYLMGRACLEGINVQQDIERGIGLLNAVAHIENESADVAALRCKAANALFAHYYEINHTNSDAEALKKCRKLADLGAELGAAELGSETAAAHVKTLEAQGYTLPDISMLPEIPTVQINKHVAPEPVFVAAEKAARQPEPAAPLSRKEAKAALKAQKALEKQQAKAAKAAEKEAKKQARTR